MPRSIFVIAVAMLATVFTVNAFSSGGATKAQAQDAGWDCAPDVKIGGYYHCAQPGKPSLLDLVEGKASPPSLQLGVYDGETERFAGTETLRRADLFKGDENTPCPQDPGANWVFLDFEGADYYACHRFDT